MKLKTDETRMIRQASTRKAALGLAIILMGCLWQPKAALSSSGEEWAKLTALMKRAEAQCLDAYKKENPGSKSVKVLQPSHFSASFILVRFEEALTIDGRKETRQSFCMVGRRAGKPELAGPLP